MNIRLEMPLEEFSMIVGTLVEAAEKYEEYAKENPAFRERAEKMREIINTTFENWKRVD